MTTVGVPDDDRGPGERRGNLRGAADERRRFALLLAGLDLIDQGLSVMDSDLKAVAVNRRLLTMFGFPPEFSRPGTSFADFVRYNAERGEYGEGDVEEQVAERVRLASQFEPHSMERERPDGTIIAMTGVPIPHGGLVTIFTDVTQQRAHEREVRKQNEILDRRVRLRTTELERTNTRLQNAIAEQKQLEAVLVHAQKMEAVGELAGGLAHDFNNLLTIVINNLRTLRDRAAQAPGSMEFVEPALAAAVKGADITRRLLAFARRQPLEPSIVEVNRLVANLLSMSRHSLPKAIRVSRETAPGDLHTCVDPQQLEHALLNLVLNARDAMPEGGSLMVRTASLLILNTEADELEVTPGRYVELRIEDTGAGMDQATLARAVEPFFTTKDFGSGSGLGLSMVYGFAKQSGGALHIRSTPGIGTVVTLLLPASSAPTQREAVRFPDARPGSSRLVLLVEDDADVRTVIRRQLTEIGHMVMEASSGDEALAIIDSVPAISILVSDIVMPGAMDGRRLALLAKRRRPALRVVLVTGYAEGLGGQTDGYRPFSVLRKPCTKEELGAAIEAAPR